MIKIILIMNTDRQKSNITNLFFLLYILSSPLLLSLSYDNNIKAT